MLKDESAPAGLSSSLTQRLANRVCIFVAHGLQCFSQLLRFSWESGSCGSRVCNWLHSFQKVLLERSERTAHSLWVLVVASGRPNLPTLSNKLRALPMNPLGFNCGLRLYPECVHVSHACMWCRTWSTTQARAHSQWLASCLVI